MSSQKSTENSFKIPGFSSKYIMFSWIFKSFVTFNILTRYASFLSLF